MSALPEIKTLHAKWLDPACHEGCQSLVLKQRIAELEKTAWRCEAAPRDGTWIVASGVVMANDGPVVEAIPFCETLRWTAFAGESEGWHDRNGMSLRTSLDDEVHVHQWLRHPYLNLQPKESANV